MQDLSESIYNPRKRLTMGIPEHALRQAKLDSIKVEGCMKGAYMAKLVAMMSLCMGRVIQICRRRYHHRFALMITIPLYERLCFRCLLSPLLSAPGCVCSGPTNNLLVKTGFQNGSRFHTAFILRRKLV